LAKKRTDLAIARTEFSETRTVLAKRRTELADTRTVLSSYRSVLARGRTELAFIRTGLALIALGAGMMRYFGFGTWTVLDGGLIAVGTAMVLFGTKGYVTTRKYERTFVRKLKDFLTVATEAPQD
jgi:uncharacterized membrane protein YidH (DUF202 family)